MAIDTAFKRRSSAASRRMPWMRRFSIAPDGTIGQSDRQSGPWVYAGILAPVVDLKSGPVVVAALAMVQIGPRALSAVQIGPRALAGVGS